MGRALLVISVMGAWAGVVAGQVVTAQNYDPQNYTLSSFRTDVGYTGTGFPNTAPGQAFPASVSGRLTFMTAYMRRWDLTTSQPLEIRIHEFTPGSTGPGLMLGLVTIPASRVSASDSFKRLDLSSAGVDLVAGRWYAFAFHAAPPSSTPPYSFTMMTAGSPTQFGSPYLYSRDGTSWQRTSTGTEILLRVEVPAPASVGVLALAGVIAFQRRRPSVNHAVIT